MPDSQFVESVALTCRIVATKELLVGLLAKADIRLNGDRASDIRVHDERFWDRIAGQRELGFGESYIDGWWDCGALDQVIAKVQGASLRDQIRITPTLAFHVARSVALNNQTTRRAAKNARHHYDIGNDLYERMLGERMVYSCAYWRSNGDDLDTLDQAQEAKLDLVCRKLGLEPGMRLLDIGCGWGGLARFAAERYGALVVGISPAGQQVKVATERCRDLPVEIRQQDYRDVRGTFDRITSIGMMEHVGPRNLKRFFDVCGERLADDGMMLHHTIGSNESKSHIDPWFDKYIFPGGNLPSIAHIAAAAEKRWVIEDLHNFGPDYDRTLMAWHANAEAAWADLPNYDERFRRMWRYYLLASAGSFRARNLQLWQIVFRKIRTSPTYTAPR